MGHLLELPFGIRRATRGEADIKFRVADNTARDTLITQDLIEEGHLIYHELDKKHYKLEIYTTYGDPLSATWTEVFTGGAGLPDIPADNMLANTNPLGLNPPTAKTPSEIRTLLNVDNGAQVNRSNAQLKIDYESNANTNAYTDADRDKIAFIAVTQAVDLDTMESDITVNNAKVSNTITDLSFDANTGVMSSSDGNDATIPLAAGLNRGLISGSDKNKLDNIENNATANSTDATLLNRANHTGTQLANTISDFSTTVLSTILTGISFASSIAITATDTVLSALGKLQAQITSIFDLLKIRRETIYIDGAVTTFEIPFNNQISSESFEADFANEIQQLDITVRVGGSTTYDTASLNVRTTDGTTFTDTNSANAPVTSPITTYSTNNSIGYKYLVVTVTKKATWTYSTAFKFIYKQV